MYNPYPTTAPTATNGNAVIAAVPIAVPTAAAVEATVPIPDATADPAEVTTAPTPPKPIVAAAFPIPDAVEFIEFDKAFTALLLAVEIAPPIVLAPADDKAAPEHDPIVAPAAPAIAL